MCRYVALIVVLLLTAPVFAQKPFQSMGFKVGEPTSTSVVVWTRLTEESDHEQASQSGMQGRAGEVRLTWWVAGTKKETASTEWLAVDAKNISRNRPKAADTTIPFASQNSASS